MKKELKKLLTPRNIIIASVVLVALILGIIFLWEPAVELFNQRDRIEEFIMSFGALAPVMVILLQIVQVIIAPIPGNVTSFIAGYLFGWWGLLLTIVGSTIGFIIVVLLSRRFGRPLIEKFFKPQQIAKFDGIIKKNGGMALFLIFLFPFFPDDLLSYMAGLTKISLKKLILICIVGRFPGYLLLNLAGSGVNDGDIWLIVGIVATVAIVGMILWWQKDWLQKFVHADNHWEFIKKTFKKK